jgi:hypothetical protein
LNFTIEVVNGSVDWLFVAFGVVKVGSGGGGKGENFDEPSSNQSTSNFPRGLGESSTTVEVSGLKFGVALVLFQGHMLADANHTLNPTLHSARKRGTTVVVKHFPPVLIITLVSL